MAKNQNKINRIYQGRVTKAEVEIQPQSKGANNSPLWENCSDWEALLSHHHELFQDAVNYYLLAFAALAAGQKQPSDDNKDCPIYKLRGQMKDKWDDFSHKGVRRRGMRKSVAKYLFPSEKAKSLSFEKCIEKILQGNSANPKDLHKALDQLIEEVDRGEGVIKEAGRQYFPMFCDKKTKATFPREESALKKREGEFILQTKLLKLKKEEYQLFANNIQYEWLANISKRHQAKTEKKWLEESIEKLEAWLGKSEPKSLPMAFKENFFDFKKAQKEISAIKNKINLMPEGEKVAYEKTNIKTNCGILFKHFPSYFTYSLLYLLWRGFKASEPKEEREKRQNKKIQNTLKDKERKEEQDKKLLIGKVDPIKFSRGKRGYVFPSFTALLKNDKNSLGLPEWKEFDIAAFKEALTVIHQVNQKTEERESKKAESQKTLDWMEKRQWTKKKSDGTESQIIKKWQTNQEDEGEEPLFIGQFKRNEKERTVEYENPDDPGDPRIKRLRKLLEFDLAMEYFGEDDTAGKIPYGLRRRTLRGFGEIQKKWREILNKKRKSSGKQKFSGSKSDEEGKIKKDLKEALDAYQKKNKYSIGSASLFNELLQPENWIIWREPNESEKKKYEEKNFAENPLEALCDYYELEEEIKKLRDPVKFTPADPEHSRRLFRFGDACSWPKVKNKKKQGKERGEYGHDENSLSLRAPIMAQTANGAWKKQRIKLHYSAPRLLRDELRRESNESLEKAPWIQPMMKALGCPEPSEQDFWSCNVQLMPDKKKSGDWRYLLNFPMEINIKDIKLSNGPVDWEKNCKAGGDKYLKWPRTLKWAGDKKMKDVKWFEKTNSFCCLSVDLGQRTAGAFAVISAGNNQEKGRNIGKANDKTWRAHVKAAGILRLPGEDMKFFDKGILKTEPYGSKGRKASEEEWKQAETIISELCGADDAKDLLGGAADHSGKIERNSLSFPELNDKLLVAARRSQGRLSQYYRWAWMLEEKSRKEKALEEIKKQEENKAWRELAEKGGSKAQHLQTRIKGEISRYQKNIKENLLLIANRILPLRGRKWEWVEHPEKRDCHLLRQKKHGTDTTNKKLCGQRGLSMKRIEQIEELRRRFQSLNQSQRRLIGRRPLTSSEMRNDPVPDPCPDLLKKLEEIKKQRVNQTAHLILAEALGVKLKPPSLSREERGKKDIHGEYKKIREPVNFIVIENLSRYKMKQDRSPRENSRLMQWSHRAVTKKLKELCEPYGIPVLEAVAAYSSKFCSRSAVPGFRAEEVTIRDKRRYPYINWIQKEDKEDTEHAKRREFLEDLFKKLEKSEKRTGLVPKDGGPIFVPIKSCFSEKGESNLKPVLIQADINAAVNIGLRAIASPLAEKIHHRVRSERKGSEFIVRLGSIEERRYKKKTNIKINDELDKLNKHSDFFIDCFDAADFEKAKIEGSKYSSGKAIWTAVKGRKWDRCKEFNNKILNKAGDVS